MSKRVKKSLLKIKSSDGDEFEVTDDVVKEIETRNTMVTCGDEEQEEGDYKEQIPTFATDGMSLKKILVWTECQIYFKQMDLKLTSKRFMLNVNITSEVSTASFH